MNADKVLLIVLIITMAGAFPIHAVEPFWADFYKMATTREEAIMVPLDSEDAMALKESAVYFYATVNGLDNIEQERKTKVRSDNSELAVNYITAAYNLDSSNTMIATWRATIACSHAGAIIALWPKKIKTLKMGVQFFNSIPKEDNKNLDLLNMRIITFSFIPGSILDMTTVVLEDIDSWFMIYNQTANLPYWHNSRLENMKLLKAKAWFDSGNREAARKILSGIDISRLTDENDTRVLDIRHIYAKLKTRLGL